MNTRRIVLLLFCLLLAGAVAQLLAPEHRLVAEDRPGFQGEDSPLYLPLVVNQSEVPGALAAGTPAKAAQLFYGSQLERAFDNAGNEAPGRRFLPECRIEREQLPIQTAIH